MKPERDQNARATYRDKWWIHGEPRRELRAALRGLTRYIATVETAKHRTFQFLDASILPDNKLIAIALDDAYPLGVLSSRVHVAWALAAGGRLGVGNDARYNKSRCFETFPFPSEDTGLTAALRERIASLAEQIDAHRKRVLTIAATATPTAGLTLTGLYNVLDALREGRTLTVKEKAIHDAGLVAVLKSLHDELDAAVLAAYGWADLTLPRDEQTLLARLVALNTERAVEEASGTIRYLRAAYQDPAQRANAGADASVSSTTQETAPTQISLVAETPDESQPKPAKAKARKPAWPSTLPERMKAVANVLADRAVPMDVVAVANTFSGIGPASEERKQLPEILATLVALGRAQAVSETEFAAA